MADLVEKDLSYKITGILFNVYNNLGGGYQEKYYQRAVATTLASENIKFTEQVVVPLKYEEASIGRYFLDFLVEDRIILELKAAPQFYSRDIKQVLAYLKAADISLGILASFTKRGLQLKRILQGSKN